MNSLSLTGNCELSKPKTDWDDYNNGTAANYYNSKEEANESWYLFSQVNAKGVSATGIVGLLVKDRYTESQDTLFGTANLTVKRNAYIWHHWNIFLGFKKCNNIRYRDALGYVEYCGGHTEPAEVDSNIPGTEGFKPFYDSTDLEGNPVPRHTTIALKAKVREPTYKILSLRTLTTGHMFTVEVKADHDFVQGRVTTEYSVEAAETKSITAIQKRERVINEAETSSHSVYVEFEKKADCSATADVSFNGVSSTSKTVTYTGVP